MMVLVIIEDTNDNVEGTGVCNDVGVEEANDDCDAESDYNEVLGCLNYCAEMIYCKIQK